MIYCDGCGIVPVPDDQLPVLLPKIARVQRAGRLAARAGARVRERRVPPVRPAGAARDRHDGHLRGLVLVLLPLLRPAQRRAGVRPGRRRVLGAGGLLQRRRRARDPAPHLLALLLPRVPRPRDGAARRAVRAPADAGHGAQGRRGHVEVEGQRRRSRRHDRQVRRRRPAALRHVRRAAREGDRVDRRGARGQLPLPGARVAARRSPDGRPRGDARAGARRRRARRRGARAQAEDPRHDPPRDAGPVPEGAPEHGDLRDHGARERPVPVLRPAGRRAGRAPRRRRGGADDGRARHARRAEGGRRGARADARRPSRPT